MANVTRAEFEALQEAHDFAFARIIVHDATLLTMANTMATIQTDMHELKEWKDDSKIQEIAVLKGRLRKSDKVKDRVLLGLLILVSLETLWLIVEKWFHW